METLHNGFTLKIAPNAFALSTDSIALAHFARLPRNARVLDLGSGCGTLGLLLCANNHDCTVTGIELDNTAHRTALENIADNQLSSRLSSICKDLRDLPSFLEAGSFSACISNPPYFFSGAKSRSVPTARHEEYCSLNDLFQSAAWALKYGGDFFMVHRPERLAEIFACANAFRLEPKKLCLLRHRTDGPVSLILLQLRKGANPGLTWEEQSLYDTQGIPTAYYQTIYHI